MMPSPVFFNVMTTGWIVNTVRCRNLHPSFAKHKITPPSLQRCSIRIHPIHFLQAKKSRG